VSESVARLNGNEGATTVVMAVTTVAQFGIGGGVEMLIILLIAVMLFDAQKSSSVRTATSLPANTGHRLLYCNVAVAIATTNASCQITKLCISRKRGQGSIPATTFVSANIATAASSPIADIHNHPDRV